MVHDAVHVVAQRKKRWSRLVERTEARITNSHRIYGGHRETIARRTPLWTAARIAAFLCRETWGIESAIFAEQPRAIKLHRKLMGHFAPDRKEIEVGNHQLMNIKERAKKLGQAMSLDDKHGIPAVLDD